MQKPDGALPTGVRDAGCPGYVTASASKTTTDSCFIILIQESTDGGSDGGSGGGSNKDGNEASVDSSNNSTRE